MAKRTNEQPIMRGVKAAVEADQRPIPHSYIAASLLPGEPAASRYNNNTGRDFDLMCRAVSGTAYRAVSINSTCCASKTLRLYRRTGRQNKRYQTRAVTDRRVLKYLRGDGSVKPTVCKGANYAAKAGDGIEEVLVHPILDVLQNPDPVYSGQVWMQAIWFQLEAAGRAYLWGGERTNGIPTSLYILPSAYTWPVTSESGLISGYVYARNRTSMLRAEAEDTVYLRQQASPFNPAGAMSWLNSVTGETDMENAAIRAEVARWNNGGMPGMVLKASPTTTDPQMGQIQAALSRAIQGVGKAGSMLLLRDTELVQYATKPHEMQYVAGMEATQKRIFGAAGIPESMRDLNAANLASAQVSDRQYMMYTIAPRLATMASQLTELLLPMFGVEPGEMWFMFDSPVHDDQVALAAEYRAGELQGVIAPNEYRTLLDLESLPDEQNVLRFRQTEAPAPAFDPFAAPVTTEQPKPEAKAEPLVVDPNADVQATALNGAQVQALANLAVQVTDGQLPMESAQALAQAAFPLVDQATMDRIFGPLANFTPEAPANDGNPAPEPGTKSRAKTPHRGECKCGTCGAGGSGVGSGPASGEAGGVGADGTKAATVPPTVKLKSFIDEWDEAAMVPKSTAKLFTQFANAMDTWYLATMPAMVDDTLVVSFPSPEAMKRFDQLTSTFVGKLLENGAAVGIAKLPGEVEGRWNIANENAMAYVRDRSLELAKSVPETMKGSLQAIIEKELANPEGFTVDSVKLKINEAIPELSGYQSERLARTETADAFVEGERQAWKAEGVQNKQWLLGGEPCVECSGVASKYPNEIPIDQPFEYGGRSKQGPAWHPNCVCSLAPGLEYNDE